MEKLKNNLTFVSIIIPCRNEEKFISECLESLLAQNYPKENLEILVIDGMSEDRTREILKKYTEKYFFVRILDNPKKFIPYALNIGVKNAKGDIIARCDAHSKYQKDHISKCVKYLNEYEADNVGGVWKIMPQNNTLINKAIVLASSSIFGAGNAYYRRGVTGKPRLADTVFCGCYKKEVFEKIGYFNEKILRSEDMEFNLRLKKAGGKILLVPDIIIQYYPKNNLIDFFKHNIKDGIWAVYPLKFVKMPLQLRHYIPLFFVLGLFLSLILTFFSPAFFLLFLAIIYSYLIASLFFSFKIALEENNLDYLFIMPIVFGARHFGYGIGSIWGLVKLII